MLHSWSCLTAVTFVTRANSSTLTVFSFAQGVYAWRVGEPFNVIISGLSDAEVLTDAGFIEFARYVKLPYTPLPPKLMKTPFFHVCRNPAARDSLSAIGFSDECLGLHMGEIHEANLGDGLGWRPAQMLLRQKYSLRFAGGRFAMAGVDIPPPLDAEVADSDNDEVSTDAVGVPVWGSTCWESWAGGNHFRAWKQNGTDANSGAWFLAVSQVRLR